MPINHLLQFFILTLVQCTLVGRNIDIVSIRPLTAQDCTVWHDQLAFAMPQVIGPIACEHAAVRLLEHAVTMFSVHFKIALKASAVGVRLVALSVPRVVFPLACVRPAIGPLVNALALDSVFEPVTFVAGAVHPRVAAFSVLFSLEVMALVFVVELVGPHFFSVAVAQVVLPFSFVNGSG